MENNENNNEIMEIVKLANQKPASKPSDEKKEYEYGLPEAKSGLDFETVEVPGTEEAVAQFTNPEPVIADTSDSSAIVETEAGAATDAAPEETVQSEEFAIPEVFEVNERYNTPATPDVTAHVHTTYIPRFTGASDHYRMKDDPRPRKNTETVETTVAERVDIADAKDTAIDPTAEIDESAEGAVIVTPSPKREESFESLSVYKFADDTAEKSTEEDELAAARAEFEALVGKKPDAVDETASEPEAEETVVEETAEEAPKDTFVPIEEKRPLRTDVPDPEPSELVVVDYTKTTSARTEVIAEPEGVVDLPATAKSDKTEFMHVTQRDGFKDKFLDSLMAVKIRFFAALIFSVVLLVYETLAAFGVLSDSFESVALLPGVVGIIDLLFVLSVFALAIPEVVSSVKQLFVGKLTANIMLLPSVILIAVYSVITAIRPVRSYMLVGFIFAVFVLAVIGSSYCRLKGDFTAFKVISRNAEKRVLDKKLTRTLPEENIALDGLVDEYKSRTARIFRAGFITDFFKRTAKCAEDQRHLLKMLGISFGAALVVGLICLFIPGGIVSAFSGFTLVFLLGCPALSLLSHKLPYHDAQKAALAEESTVIGESSYRSFSEVDVIAFDDTEIFGPDDVNLKRFMFYGSSASMEKAMQQMCSIFSVVGGPLNHIFENTLDRRVRHMPATGIVIEDGGVSGIVSGQKVCAGGEEYMKSHGIAIPESSDKPDRGFDTIKVMYAAENGEIYAKFYIRYSFSEEFTMLLPTLKEEGIVPLIYTRDPNVSNDLLRILSAGSDCMRIMRRYSPDKGETVYYRNISAGVVTYGDKINAINTILITKKHQRLSTRAKNMELYAMGAGLGLGALISIFGMSSVPSFVFGIWQLAWCFVLGFASRNIFLKDRNK